MGNMGIKSCVLIQPSENWKPKFNRTTQAWENCKNVTKIVKNQNMAIFDTLGQSSQARGLILNFCLCSHLVPSRQNPWNLYCPHPWQKHFRSPRAPPLNLHDSKLREQPPRDVPEKKLKQFWNHRQHWTTYFSGRAQMKKVAFWTTPGGPSWGYMEGIQGSWQGTWMKWSSLILWMTLYYHKEVTLYNLCWFIYWKCVENVVSRRQMLKVPARGHGGQGHPWHQGWPL